MLTLWFNLLYNYFTYYSSFLIFFFIIWYFFFKFNNLKIQNTNSMFVFNNTVVQKESDSVFIVFFLKFIICNLFFFIISLGFDITFMYNNNYLGFECTNFNLFLVFNFTLFTLLFMCILLKLQKNCLKLLSLEYVFILLNLFLFFCLLFLVENLYTFFMLIEICSLLIFLKLLNSKIFKNEQCQNYNQLLNYMNLIFFHYWVSFFSTMLILFFLILFYYYYGSVEYIYLLFFKNFSNDYLEYFLLSFFCFLFTITITLKLGISPIHLFKLEMYNALNYTFLFFYLVYYFCGFFLIFFITYLKFILPVCGNFVYFFLFIIFFSMIFMLYFLFDFATIKIFFALSTAINLITFFLITLLLFF